MLKLIFSENVKSPGSLESLNRLLAIPRASDRMIPWSEDETNFVTRLQSRHVHAYAKGVFSCELRSSARHKSTINVNTKKEREKKKKAACSTQIKLIALITIASCNIYCKRERESTYGREVEIEGVF